MTSSMSSCGDFPLTAAGAGAAAGRWTCCGAVPAIFSPNYFEADSMLNMRLNRHIRFCDNDFAIVRHENLLAGADDRLQFLFQFVAIFHCFVGVRLRLFP